jgi:asparagine synthase (glutamine-hydrolysing)
MSLQLKICVMQLHTVSSSASQPMQDASGRYQIVFNGEIYNYQEIKKQLQSKGYRFNNNSDTEVILNAYAEWGKDCLKLFNGMFALAIWDTEQKMMFIARDRFGKKPFYYTILPNNTFLFASEISALLTHPKVSREIDMEAVNCYLSIGYILAPLSIYKNIKKFPAASYGILSNGGNNFQMHSYWDYAEYLSKPKVSDEAAIKENLKEHILSAVNYRLISDVPVGAFLSGGVDSSSIVAAVRKQHNKELCTFSIGFDQDSYNEINEAREIAKLFNTNHYDELLNVENSKELILQSVDLFDEPFSDNSLIPMYKVSELASKHVKVVLSGDGADELFGGYITYKADGYYQKYQKMPAVLRKLAYNLVKNNKINEQQKIGFQYKLRQFLQGGRGDYSTAHYSWRLIFPPEIRQRIMGNEYKELINDTDPLRTFKKYFEKVKHLHWLDQALYVDAMTWLTDDILVKVDRTTMKHGLEARAPYLDVNLVEYAATINPLLKLNKGVTKYILKEALTDWLPQSTLYRKKSGFNAPVGSWIGNAEGDEFRSFNIFVYNRKINGTTS